MKIVHIISSLDSSQGGPPNVVLNFAEFQKSKGHNVSVVSQFSKINYKDFKNIEDNLVKIKFLFENTIFKFIFIKKIYITSKSRLNTSSWCMEWVISINFYFKIIKKNYHHAMALWTHLILKINIFFKNIFFIYLKNII